jgi:23S rRNA (cytosine1962-C5)-methyltransferase
MSMPVIQLRIYRSSPHQWIYAKMVRPPKRPLPPGTIVRCVNNDGSFAGIGIYNPASTITIRMLTTQDVASTGPDFFRLKLAAAKHLREEVLGLHRDSDCYRLLHSESDGLPGLIIDRYGPCLLVKPYSSGYKGEVMDWIADLLRDLYPGATVHVAADVKACAKDKVDYAAEERRFPVKGQHPRVTEYGASFQVDLEGGQKTGFFLDQKLNRRLAAEVSRGRSVLDLYCYTGGFAIQCLRAGAASAEAVDLDPAALETAQGNAIRNGVEVTFHHQDCFEFLRKAAAYDRQYDLVIADPAKLAAVKSEVSRGLRTFNDLNELAIRCVKPGGLLFTFSCTGLVSDKVFQSVVFNAATRVRANLRVLCKVGPSPDHPFTSTFPEGRYLNGILAQVEPL